MSKTKQRVMAPMPFREAISELSEMVCTAPSSDGETQDKGVHLLDSIRHHVASLDKEIDGLQDSVNELKDEVESLKGDWEDARDFRVKVESNSIQAMDTIYYSTENLLDQEVMEALGELITKHGSLSVLRLLGEYK